MTPISEALPPLGQRVRCLMVDGRIQTLKLREMPRRRGRCWQVKYAFAANVRFDAVRAWEPMGAGE